MNDEPKVRIEIKTLQDWIKQAKELVAKGKEEGLTYLSEMSPEDQDTLTAAMAVIRTAKKYLDQSKPSQDVMSPESRKVYNMAEEVSAILHKWGLISINEIPDEADRKRVMELIQALKG